MNIIFKTIDDAKNWITGRKSAYKITFSYTNLSSRMVLADLADFCRAFESPAVPGDHDRTMLLIGRNEVWHRIQQHLNLSPEQLLDLYTGKGNPQ